MRIAILTSNHLRHHYFVNTIAAHQEVVLVVREKKRDVIETSSKEDVSAMSKHLAERDRAEEQYFGAHQDVTAEVFEAAATEINSHAVYEKIVSKSPDALLLFGTSIVRERLLNRFVNRVVNMHLGLSPYYRGTATNFWPLVNAEPECVGATIHLATLKVDGGPILHQVRPEVKAGDRAHDLGCKAIISGTQAMISVLERMEKGELSPVPQSIGGRLYRRKDFSGEAVRKLWDNLDHGMIQDYLSHIETRMNAKPLIELSV